MSKKPEQSQDIEQLNTFLNYVKLLGYFFALITAAALFLYMLKFGGNGLGNTDQFGQFGDYIGGLLNPSLSFITILLLIWSIRVQMSELAATREELKKSSIALEASQIAHQENVALQKRENIRRQINDDFKQRLLSINNLLDKPVFPVATPTDKGRVGYKLISFNDVYTEAKANGEADASKIVDLYKEQPFPPEFLSDISITKQNIAKYLEYLCNCVVELYRYLDNTYVSESVYIQASEVFEKCESLNIIKLSQMKTYFEKLRIPRK